MRCAWQEICNIIPPWICRQVEGKRDTLQELRLRIGRPPEMMEAAGISWGSGLVTERDISFCVNTASRYSPWVAQTAAEGYITAPGGHRIGLCGEVVVQEGRVTGIRRAESLNIRIARDFVGICGERYNLNGSILLLGPPGSGKTTFLRDLARELAERETVSVVDERGELFPAGFRRGRRMDVLTGCSKVDGIGMVLRTMGPDTIAVDEITAAEDCRALVQAGWCGVRLLATAHAASQEDLRSRKLYRPLWETGLFEHIIVLNRDKSWKMERMTSWQSNGSGRC